MKKILIFLILLFGTIHSGRAAYYPSTLWSSQTFSEHLIGIRVGNVLGVAEQALVTLSPQGISIYQLDKEIISKHLEYKGLNGHEWIKLNLFDLDHDGVDEIVVSGFYLGRIESQVLKVLHDRIEKIQTLDSYLHILSWEGKLVLMGQGALGGDDFTGPFYPLIWDGHQLLKGKPVRLSRGVSVESIPLYSVEGLSIEGKGPSHLRMDQGGRLSLHEKAGEQYEKRWVSGTSYGGPVYYLNREIRNALNQVEQRRFFVPVSYAANQRFPARALPPVPVVEPPILVSAEDTVEPVPVPAPVIQKPLRIYLTKNEGYLKNVMGAVPSVKNSQMVRLTWTGHGFQEDWNSPRFDGALSDFTLIDWDGDGTEEILATLLLREKGYFDTLKNQESILVVLKIQN